MVVVSVEVVAGMLEWPSFFIAMPLKSFGEAVGEADAEEEAEDASAAVTMWLAVVSDATLAAGGMTNYIFYDK